MLEHCYLYVAIGSIVCACINACVHLCVCACVHVFVRVCMHAYIFVHALCNCWCCAHTCMYNYNIIFIRDCLVFKRTAKQGAATAIDCAVNPQLNSQQCFYYDSCAPKQSSPDSRYLCHSLTPMSACSSSLLPPSLPPSLHPSLPPSQE